MNVSIAILTYNRCHLLDKLLDSILNLNSEHVEIIVVDNCSTDLTKSLFDNAYEQVNYIRMNKNIGVGARNVALKEAKGDIIITIDDDIFGLTELDIDNLRDYFFNNENVGAINFKVLDNKTNEICNWIHHKKVENYSEKDFLTYEISEGAVAFRKKALELAGYYPDYFFLSHEGPDLAFRILDSGYEVRYSPLVCVLHSHADEGRKLWYRYYYDTRNQFLLALRNFPIGHSVAFLSRGLLSTFFYSVRDGFLRYWLKGVFDGVRQSMIFYRDRQVLSNSTMGLIAEIDAERPSFIYMFKKRVFRKKMRL